MKILRSKKIVRSKKMLRFKEHQKRRLLFLNSSIENQVFDQAQLNHLKNNNKKKNEQRWYNKIRASWGTKIYVLSQIHLVLTKEISLINMILCLYWIQLALCQAPYLRQFKLQVRQSKIFQQSQICLLNLPVSAIRIMRLMTEDMETLL